MSNTTSSNPASLRIANLLDEGSFVEIGGQVTARATDFNMQEKKAPTDGVITGYGVIDGNLVYVYSQDASVLNGTIGEMHAKKIANIYDMAMKMGAPVIGLIDCAGLRLQEATDALNAFGSFYYKQAMASGVIPQITAVFGNCGGGLAAAAALSDFTFMAENGKLFVNSPNTIPGNTADKCDTASAKFQSEESGIVDGVGSEEEILGEIRSLVAILPANNEDNDAYDECTDDLNRVCADLEASVADPAITLPMISDSGIFFETKAEYGKDMVTGFIKLNGTTVGAVANRSTLYDEDGNAVEQFNAEMSARGCEKAASFVKFCDAFNIPIVSLVDVPGFLPGTGQEYNGVILHGAKLLYAYGEATVPKVTITLRKSYGGSHIVMSCKQLRGDMNYAWPTAEIAVMGGAGAVEVLYAREAKEQENPAQFLAEKEAEYTKLFANPYNAAKYGYIDDVIEPRNTRFRVIRALQQLQTKKLTNPAKKHGNIPL